MKPVTLGLIVGNRGFFPNHLCESGRKEMIGVLEAAGFRVVALGPGETPFGSIESLEDARKCSALFRANRAELDGILVTLPNFGDERAIANAIRWSELTVPILVHAFPDATGRMTLKDRRDSFCGKMSACNNLRQHDIPFTLTRLHTVDPKSESFRRDLADFGGVCRVVRTLRSLRVGAIGARPAAFHTVRYSEKLLQKYGITVETLDLYELFGHVNRLADDAPAVQSKLDAIRGYVDTHKVPAGALVKMAKFGVAVDDWMKRHQLHATAIQCWSALEEFFGIVPCAVMSLMSHALLPSACEVDVTGAVAMAALAQAGGRPSALVDWNNNYDDDPDKGVVFHCSNLPKDVFQNKGANVAMDCQDIIAGTVGKENAYGTVVGRVEASPFTFLRISTDDATGTIRAYVGEGEFTNDPLETFGGYGVVRVRNLQGLLRYICENGFEHHVAVNPTTTAAAIHEALTKYLGWNVYWHGT